MRLAMPGGGTRFWISRMPPGHGTQSEYYRMAADAIRDMGGTVDPDDIGLHDTPTIDYVVVLAGEVTLVLDDDVVTLGPFDTVVQRGTSHRWENRTDRDAVIALVMVDAKSTEGEDR
jgi:hypothetical protein